MERRRAVIAAATASLTLLAGAAAISLNTGIVGASRNDRVGQISPVDTVTAPATVYTEPAPAGRPSAAVSNHAGDDHAHGDEHTYEGAGDDD